jgi:squalene synthase HpnC
VARGLRAGGATPKLRRVSPFRHANDVLDRAYAACAARAAAHAENFPTASLLLPAPVRRHVSAFYAFARTADDWADEPGRGTRDQRRAALHDLRARITASPDGDALWIALAHSRRALGLGPELFVRLLAAFERDLDQSRYDTWDDLLTYCHDSADPVGRLVLAAAGDTDPLHGVLSDRLCTALQLVNFWQDLSVDEPRGRYYLPRAERARWGDARALAYAVARTRRLLDEAAPLPERAPPALRLWLRAVHAGGSIVLTRVEALGADAFQTRPSLAGADRARMAAGALWPRGAGTTFGASFRMLAPAAREALAALHAFCRVLDDAIDDAPDADAARAGLAWARAETARLHAGAPEGAAGARLVRAWDALAAGESKGALLAEGLAALLDGLAADAGGGVIRTDDDLARYARAVGGGPGVAALPVFGRPDARAFALKLGEALQRANILRDVAVDARAGRVYLPAEDLARAGVPPEALSGETAPAGYRNAALPLVARARAAFAAARAAVPAGAAAALAPALVMARLYEDVLERIGDDPTRVWRERVRPSAWRAGWIVFVAGRRAAGGA